MSELMLASDIKISTSGTSRRFSWVDLAKGAGILLVALGHLTNGASESIWLPALAGMHFALYLFHMPLFFILGGMVLHVRNRNLRDFAGRRARTLLVSYYVFSLYFLAKPLVMVALPGLAMSFGLSADEVDVAGTLWNVLVMGEGLWFLWAYFWAQVLAFVLLSLAERVSDRVGELASCLTVAALGCVLVVLSQAWHIMHLGHDLPFQLLRGVWGAGYVLIGYASMPLLKTLKRMPSLALGSLLLIAFLYADRLLIGKREPALWGVIIYNGTLGLTAAAVSLGVALLGAGAVILLARAWDSCLPLEHVGQESLAYYALSPLVMNACKLLVFSVLGVSLAEATGAAQLACGLALSLASVVLTAPLVRLIDAHAPWLFGQKQVAPQHHQ